MQSVKWDQQYAKFKEHAGMPKKGSPLYSWKDTQLAIRPGGLNARIVKEIENNEGGTVWSDMRDTTKRCVAIKICHTQSVAPGISSMQSSKNKWGSLIKEARYIIGNRVSWLLWMRVRGYRLEY
jgi:hypothetical protein